MSASEGERRPDGERRVVLAFNTFCGRVRFGGKTRRLPGGRPRLRRARAVRVRVRRVVTAARWLQAGAALHSRALDQVGAPELQPVGGGVFEDEGGFGMRDRYLEADTMLHVLHENRKVRPNYDNMKFADSQLVDLDSLPQMQRVTMFSDQVRRFRDDYT